MKNNNASQIKNPSTWVLHRMDGITLSLLSGYWII